MIEMMIDKKKSIVLLNNWNKIFNKKYNIELNEENNLKELFESYLYSDIIHTDGSIDYCDKICVIDKYGTIREEKYDILQYKKSSYDLNNINRIQLKNICDKCEILITNFPIIVKNTIVLREEIVRNFFNSNHTHFFSKDLLFPSADYNVYLTETFYKKITSNKELLNKLEFNSKILNYFETGYCYDDINIKPTINISDYGRWYWSNTYKIQTDKKSRNSLIKKLSNYGSIISVDLTSGEPSILANLTNSKTLKMLLQYRNTYNKQKDFIKKIMNLYIHSVSSPKQNYNYIMKTNKDDAIEFENTFGIKLIDIFSNMNDEMKEYNNYIIDEYKNNLCAIENSRRIINPYVSILKDKEILKEHRKFLQAETHDLILSILKIVMDNNDVTPLWTIHDSFSIMVDKSKEDDIINNIKSITERLNIKATITINI